MHTRSISFACVALLAACATRSISDSGYPGYGSARPNFAGELNELELLGAAPDSPLSENDVGNLAVLKDRALEVPKGSKVILIQSGAVMPDEDMIDAMAQNYTVVPVSGVPFSADRPSGSLGRGLRAMAAKGGASTIVCYWGVLETSRNANAGKSVSWVPVAGWFTPDESQEMRIRLKMAVIDVTTGRWEFLLPKVYSDQAASSLATRERSDQDQVALLKRAGYRAAAEELVRKFGK